MALIRSITTRYGRIRGLPAADPRITSYKGIPFAAPPVGDRRWRAPQPCASWQGELTAYDYGPISPQAISGKNKENIYTREWHVEDDPLMDEDCLYLNVWAPADGRQNLPVFVWYFGGGLQVGSTTEMEFDGERIARRGIVVVTINYRLNVFGFLAHPQISRQEPGPTANFGFLDQQFATQWVKDNIAAFGGDPNNITIGGQSAGGMSVSAQIAHQANEGLFDKAVIISGLFARVYPAERLGLTVSLPEAEKRGERFLTEVLKVNSLAEARALPWQKVLEAALQWKEAGMWPACVDGDYLQYPPDQWYLHEQRVQCPVLMGSTNNEFRVAPRAQDDAALRAYAAAISGLQVDDFLACFTSPATEASIQQEGAVSSIDLAVRAAASKAQTPIFAYEFGADIPGWDKPGAFHSVDLWFFFETLAKCWRPFVGKHYDLARQMTDYLSNFIHSGDPNGLGTTGDRLPYWPRLDSKKPILMQFQDTAMPVQAPLSPIATLLLEAYLRRCQAEA